MSDERFSVLAVELKNLEDQAEKYTAQMFGTDKNPHQTKYLRELADHYRTEARSIRMGLLGLLDLGGARTTVTSGFSMPVTNPLAVLTCTSGQSVLPGMTVGVEARTNEPTFSEVLAQDGV